MDSALSSLVAAVLLVAACGFTADSLASMSEAERALPTPAKRAVAPRADAAPAPTCCTSEIEE